MSDKLTPAEVIRLGIEQGHSADVIAASLEAGIAPQGRSSTFAARAAAELEELHRQAQAMHFNQLARFLSIALAEVKIIAMQSRGIRCRFCCGTQNIPAGQDTCTVCQNHRPAMTIDVPISPVQP